MNKLWMKVPTFLQAAIMFFLAMGALVGCVVALFVYPPAQILLALYAFGVFVGFCVFVVMVWDVCYRYVCLKRQLAERQSEQGRAK